MCVLCVYILLSVSLLSCLASTTGVLFPPVSSSFEKKIPVRATVMGVVGVECSGL